MTSSYLGGSATDFGVPSVIHASGWELGKGPRGGECWRPGYFLRLETWHVFDQGWEIENRLIIFFYQWEVLHVRFKSG